MSPSVHSRQEPWPARLRRTTSPRPDPTTQTAVHVAAVFFFSSLRCEIVATLSCASSVESATRYWSDTLRRSDRTGGFLVAKVLDTCLHCSLAYRDFKLDHPKSFAEARQMMFVSEPPPWRQKRRSSVLGFWRELKLIAWGYHLGQCEWAAGEAAPVEQELVS
jgi:hypothetical protein